DRRNHLPPHRGAGIARSRGGALGLVLGDRLVLWPRHAYAARSHASAAAVRMSAPGITARRIVHQTPGHVHGPVTRLMSPGDLGEFLKQFVFLDIFSLSVSSISLFEFHTHSSIIIISHITSGVETID